MNKYHYYSTCAHCEHLYQCYDWDEVAEIICGSTYLYLHPSTCNDYYPERTQ